MAYVNYEEFYSKLDKINLEDLKPKNNTLLDLEPLEPEKEEKKSKTVKEKIEDLKPSNSQKPVSKVSSGEQQLRDVLDKTDFDSDFKDYILKLAKRESGFRSDITNPYGYSGLFQFGQSALDDVGMSYDDYMYSVDNQVEALARFTSKNADRLQDIIRYNTGKLVRGKPITKYGILAAAHLGGAGGVMNYFLSGGKRNPSDANRTSIEDYLVEFS